MSRIKDIKEKQSGLVSVDESAKSKWWKTEGNSDSIAVYKFKKGNQYRYLVGWFTPKSGESMEDFLKRISPTKYDLKDLEVDPKYLA